MTQFSILIVGDRPSTTCASVPIDGWCAVIRYMLSYVRTYGVANINRIKIDRWTHKGGAILQHGNDRQVW